MQFTPVKHSSSELSALIRQDRLQQKIMRSSTVYCKFICKNDNCKLLIITQCENLITYVTSTEENHKMGIGVAIKELDKVALKCPVCASLLGRFYITSNLNEIKRAETDKKLYNMLTGYYCDHCLRTFYLKDLQSPINNKQKCSNDVYHSKFRTHIFTQQSPYSKKFYPEGA